MHKRGQAALEFLTTYGWAFIVILIMIGALSYWGITNPRNALPERCTFAPEFGCVNEQLDTTTSTFKLRLRNSFGDVIAVQNFKLSNEQGLTCTTSPPTVGAWPAGNATDFVWSGCGFAAAAITPGTKAKVDVTFNYYDLKSGAGYAKPARGEIITSVI